MKRLTQLLFMLFFLCLPIVLQAQKRDDSKYLAGAVPEEDGKVVFSKDFSIPGMSQDEIFERMQKWMELRLKKNQNETSRVVYTNKEKGQIVGMGEEWIVFTSTALSLDRTIIDYQLTTYCQPEKCEFRIEKIRYTYREGRDQEKYTAEEWITDKYALNKSQTKLVLGLAKWRKGTGRKRRKKQEWYKLRAYSHYDQTATCSSSRCNTCRTTGNRANTSPHSATRSVQGGSSRPTAIQCHPDWCRKAGHRHRYRCFQHDHDDSQCWRFVGQDVREVGNLYLPLARPAARTA